MLNASVVARIGWLGLVALICLTACDGGADVRQWSAKDHVAAKGPAGAQTSGVTDDEDATLLSVTWRQNCARCHGMSGRGDGPEGRMVRAPDLTRADFQQRATDSEIANVIRKGRNKMPGYPSLPKRVVELLVGHIRSMKR